MHWSRSWSTALPPSPSSFVASLGMSLGVAGHPSHHSPRGHFPAFLFIQFTVCLSVPILISLVYLLVILMNWLAPFNFSGSVSGFCFGFVFFFSPFLRVLNSSYLCWELQMSLFSLLSGVPFCLVSLRTSLNSLVGSIPLTDWQLSISQLPILPQSFLALSPWLPTFITNKCQHQPAQDPQTLWIPLQVLLPAAVDGWRKRTAALWAAVNHFQPFLPIPGKPLLQKVFVGDFITSPYSRGETMRLLLLLPLSHFFLVSHVAWRVCYLCGLFYCLSQGGFGVGAPIAGKRGRSLILAATSCRVFGNGKFGKQNEAVEPMDTGMAGSISPMSLHLHRPCLCCSNRMFLCSLNTANQDIPAACLSGKALSLTLPKPRLGHFL